MIPSPETNKTTQNLQNRSFDPQFDVTAVELLGYDGSQLVRLATDSNGQVKIDPTNLDTRYLGLHATADKATILATARTIGGISFDGSANIKIGALNSTNVNATTSAELAGVISDETGSGKLVFADAPTINGTLTVEKDTAGTYDTTTISAILGDTDSGDSTFLIGNTINGCYSDINDNAALWVNYRGHLGGVTKNRDFIVGDGKGNAIAIFDGSAGDLTIGIHNGSSVANGDLTLQGTSHSTRTSSYVLIQPNGGNTAIGAVSAPWANLVVDSGTAQQCMVLSNNVTTQANSAIQLDFIHSNSDGTLGNTNAVSARIESVKIGTYTAGDANSVDGGLVISTANNNSTVQRIWIDNLGYTGFGISAPTGRVHLYHAVTGGTGDMTNCVANLKIEAPTDFWRVSHISAHASVAGVYNYQTGKDVYWGETSDSGTYNFRGRAVYVEGNVSALSFTDRTPGYDGDALAELALVRTVNGLIDHSTLPEFARSTVVTPTLEEYEVPVEEVKGEIIYEPALVDMGVDKVEERRDLGAMISIHTVAFQQLIEKIATLEARLAAAGIK